LRLATSLQLASNARAGALAIQCSCGARRALRRAAACGFLRTGSRLGYAALRAQALPSPVGLRITGR
jgi:hypothetical protein